jgi:hypothetical protein
MEQLHTTLPQNNWNEGQHSKNVTMIDYTAVMLDTVHDLWYIQHQNVLGVSSTSILISYTYNFVHKVPVSWLR